MMKIVTRWFRGKLITYGDYTDGGIVESPMKNNMKCPKTDPFVAFVKRVTKWDERDPAYVYKWDKKNGWYTGRVTYGLSFRGILKYVFLKSNREERLHAWGILISIVALILSFIALLNTL